MKIRLYILFLIGFILYANDFLSQLDNATKLSAIALEYEEKGKYENAIYYYQLALSHIKEDSTYICVGYRMQFENKVDKLTKEFAYSCLDSTYLREITIADSLFGANQFVQAVYRYAQAYEYNKRYNYSLDQIERIKKEHPQVRNQMTVLNAAQKRRNFDEKIEKAKDKYVQGCHLDAYYRFFELQKDGHTNADLSQWLNTIKSRHINEITFFEETQFLAEELYLIGLYTQSLKKYKVALKLYQECTLCTQRIDEIPILIANETMREFATGISPRLANEMQTSKLSLLKANAFFRAEKYKKALKKYRKIHERGLLEAKQGEFLEEKIALCIKELNN